jgi:hypothetical protein
LRSLLVNRFRSIAVTAVAGFILVACGPAASESPSESLEASQAASEAAIPSGDGVLPSFTAGAVAALEELIPDTVGELTLTKESSRGDEFVASADADPAVAKFIDDLGVSPSDISMAQGFAFAADFSSTLFMFVIRAEGADSNTLLTAFMEAMNSNAASPMQWSSATVGGKQVQSAGVDLGSTYLYAKGDIVFWITADSASAEEVLSGLP